MASTKAVRADALDDAFAVPKYGRISRVAHRMALQHASRAKAAASEGVDLECSSSDGSAAAGEPAESCLDPSDGHQQGVTALSLPEADGVSSTPNAAPGLKVRRLSITDLGACLLVCLLAMAPVKRSSL